MLYFLFSFLPVFWAGLVAGGSTENYPVSKVAPALTAHAEVVVRLHDTKFEVINTGEATQTVKQVYTILNKNAENEATLHIPYSKFLKINYIKGTLYNKDGKVLEKLKTKDIYDLGGITSSLIDDTRIKVAKLNSPEYPFTVEYEYQISYVGSLFYPTWQPQEQQNYSVEAATFQVSVPKGSGFRFHPLNGADQPQVSTAGDNSIYTWKLTNLEASEKQLFQPPFEEITPIVYTAPNDFSIEKTTGNMQTWAAFGNWINQLNTNRNILPQPTIAQVKALVANEPDDLAKIKKLYDYLQNKTRYVSVQLGIGGWQPFEASFVDAKGYGDCKALTNYMQALLKTADINSYYTLIRAGENEPNILTNFPSNQFNHALLCVPTANDTIWLECTSQTESWGYNGSFTGNRHGLLITPEGGKIVRTTVYGPEKNLLSRKGTIVLDQTGNATATLQTTYTGLQQDDLRQVMAQGTDIQKKWLNSQISLPNFAISNFKFNSREGKIPEITEDLAVAVNKYASQSGKRYFLTLNFNNRLTYPAFSKAARVQPIVLNQAFTDSDELVYNLPSGAFHPESVPEPVVIKSLFGEYKTSCTVTADKITYTRTLKMNSGRFPATKYQELTEFYKKVSNADKSQVVLISKT